MSEVAIGIDFGTTQSKMAVLDEFGRPRPLRNAEGEEITPTVVAFEEGERPIVGREAYRQALSNPKYTFTGFKLLLGSSDVLCKTKSGKAFTATDLAALVFKKLKDDAEQALGETVRLAVVTCPANSQDDQRKKLLKAAAQAGLNVAKLIPEPTAAGIAYGLQQGIEQTVCVFDLGGGTFDASVTKCKSEQVEVLGTSGVPKLGGRDFDKAISNYVLKGFEKQAGFRPDPDDEVAVYEDLRERAEQAKLALSVRDKTTITLGARGQYATIELNRQKFEQLTKELVQQTVETSNDLLKLIGLIWNDIDKLLLVGGGSKVPAVRAAIEKTSGLRASLDIDPLHAVSFGAAIQAAVEAGGYVLGGRAIPAPKVELKDVTAYAIGCMIDDLNLGFSNAVVIPRHAPVPSSHRQRFRLKHPDQTCADLWALQGNEGDLAERCLKLGHMVLEDLPPAPDLPLRIEISADIDKNGIVGIRGKDTISGKTVEMQIDYSRNITRT